MIFQVKIIIIINHINNNYYSNNKGEIRIFNGYLFEIILSVVLVHSIFIICLIYI
jgi:hypothetical protein